MTHGANVTRSFPFMPVEAGTARRCTRKPFLERKKIVHELCSTNNRRTNALWNADLIVTRRRRRANIQ
jgi:hypothetical protein